VASALPSDDAPSVPTAHVQLIFQKALSLVLFFAFLSLARQLDVLIGARGLLPAAVFFERARLAGASWLDAPSLFWLGHSDGVLRAGAWLGMALAVLALIGRWPRACFALSAPLYLSYATVGDDFTAFQWDNMLVEVALLAALLPARPAVNDRAAWLALFALRLLVFKLYFESGLAKWQSHLRDWHDGSAMAFYYETAPLPAPLAWHAHHLPDWFHRLESWGALVLELLVPFLVLGPRRARLAAFWAFTAFQIVNTATANYGFFTYLSLALHVLLLDERDVAALAARLPSWSRPHARSWTWASTARARRVSMALLASVLSVWLLASFTGALLRFARSPALRSALGASYATIAPFRVANVYQLFGHITRERIEPQLELLLDGAWQEHDLRYKAGKPARTPSLVAPHQPRVDFRLWFYGLSFRRGTPEYVHNLIDRLCHDPAAVAPLFAAPLPAQPDAVRIVFFNYRMSSPDERAESGAFWVRERVTASPERRCR
jgi:uncharacterized membrane protein YphA (DoxX/SURF4 family)